MSDSGAETLKGIITRLKAFTGVSDIVSTRVYSRVPQGTAFPYIVVSLPDAEPFETKDTTDMTHVVRIQAFSQAKSPKEALQIRAAAIAALNRMELFVSVIGFNLIKLEIRGAVACFQEPDGQTWQSVAEFDALATS